MTDNSRIILGLLHDGPGVYHLQVVQRSKDGHDKSTRLIAEWFITSSQKLEFLMPAIKFLCQEYEGRAYININKKPEKAILFRMLENITAQLKSNIFRPLSILTSAVATTNSSEKFWVVDVDSIDIDMDGLCSEINTCRSSNAENVVTVIPTVNGYHIITRPFDLSQLNALGRPFEVKKNSHTLLCAFGR